MSVFDNLLGNWIQITDDQNLKTIENYSYETGVVEGTTDNHCIKCIAVNKCWFKNEKGKKPEPFEITKNQIIDAILNGLTPELYHFRCYCKEDKIFQPNNHNIKLIIPIGKIEWLFLDKPEWVKVMGYENKEQFLETLYYRIKESYCNGDYVIINHSRFGAKINLFINIAGIGIKKGHSY